MNINIIIYSMYRVDALRTPSRLRAGYQTLFLWRGRYDFPGSIPARRSILFLKLKYTLFTLSQDKKSEKSLSFDGTGIL